MSCYREIAENKEQTLFELASKSYQSKGRIFPTEKCKIRTDFERDENRILYSLDFRRLRHKTQVFFNAKNDHICTRMEHVLYVRSISNTIAKVLNLNTDLTAAIAIGHDLGHAPFGHSGETALRSCMKAEDESLTFKHELHGLRIVDKLATRVTDGNEQERGGLNLTFEVRDGIISHCGEDMRFKLCPKFDKTPVEILNLTKRPAVPATLEGCVVRLVDKISYVGRDIEDAMRANIMSNSDIPKEISKILGKNNAEIINNLVSDVISNSIDKPYIALSEERGQALTELINKNYEIIYRNSKISRYEKQADNIVKGLFDEFIGMLKYPGRFDGSKISVHTTFLNFLSDINYESDEKNAVKVADFIAGMTDNYALDAFEQIYGI